MEIIKAKLEDANEILKVKIKSFKEEVNLYGFGPSNYDSLEMQRSSIENSLYYKIMNEDKIVGAMSVKDKGDGHFRVNSIYVDTDYQNKGVGSIAMNFLYREFPKVKKWTLETPYKSYRNHHFYEKMGFKKVGETEPDAEKDGFYLFLYEKVLEF